MSPQAAGLVLAAGLPLDLARVPWSFLMAVSSLGLIYLLFRTNRGLLEEVGVGAREMVLLALGSVAGWAVNVPVFVAGGTYVAINMGGAVVPVMLVVGWWRSGKLPVLWSLVGATAVALVTWRIVEFHPGSGIVTRYPLFFLPVVVALVVALALAFRRPARAATLAYASGTLGALVGADLLHLPAIYAHFQGSSENTIISLGGAGVFDMVFLAGTLAMALALVLLTLLGARGRVAVAAPLAVYPARGVRLADSAHVWQSYLRIEDPNARERALAGLALSDLALREGDFPRSLRMSWLAVDSLLRNDGVKTQLGAGAPPALHEDVARLCARYETARAGPVSLREAGEANATARLLVASLAPHARLDHRLEGVA